MATIKYKVVSRKNPINDDVKWYPQSAPAEQVTEEEMIEQIEQKTTASRADIIAVLAALQVEIKHALMNGRKVKLNDIGCFRTSICGVGAPTRDSFTVGNINRCHIVFTPNPKLRTAVTPWSGNVTFAQVPDTPETPPQVVASENAGTL